MWLFNGIFFVVDPATSQKSSCLQFGAKRGRAFQFLNYSFESFRVLLLRHSAGHTILLFHKPIPPFTLTVFLVMMSVALSAEFQRSRHQQW